MKLMYAADMSPPVEDWSMAKEAWVSHLHVVQKSCSSYVILMMSMQDNMVMTHKTE